MLIKSQKESRGANKKRARNQFREIDGTTQSITPLSTIAQIEIFE